MPHALLVNFENLGHTTKNTIFRLVKLLADLSTRLYSLQNTPLDRICSVNDLGVLLDPKLKFDCHIMSTVHKAMSVLGFIKRWSKEFDDPYSTKLLFTLVRPILEYCSSVWSPQYQVHIDRFESVQKNSFCPS